MAEKCPTCGSFLAHGENATPYGNEFYLWCVVCVKYCVKYPEPEHQKGGDAQ